MTVKKYLYYGLTLLLLQQVAAASAAYAQPQQAQADDALPDDAQPFIVPFGGNAYATGKADDGSEQVSVFFWAGQAGDLCLSLRYNATDTVSVRASCAGVAWQTLLPPGTGATARLGCARAADSGYVRVDLQGVKPPARTGRQAPEAHRKKSGAEAIDLIATGSAIAGRATRVHDFSHYWGRRGPSVHLSFPFPEGETVEWFYSELTVLPEHAPTGSYYMANGFGEGYFGIQINSATERRVLFSVWSPFTTDNPNEIPEDQRVKLLKKGEKVYVGSFGNEGSGGQSYLVYPWKAGNTYKFLTRIRPDGNGATEYTAYFYTPDEQRWLLIASFLRPHTSTYYKKAHSFLENFTPENGYLSRRASYANQWAKTADGRWLYLGDSARFTTDETGRRRARMDYKGGAENGAFFLQNGAFFSDYTPTGTILHNSSSAKRKLPEMPEVEN
ncbi:MAG: DUF3472 domain-containing protein [Prevotellaceae bacterium]|jgi:hypothetical protein|nr:DUF3472 domain-containing protein [Prevotellaceae bacterium]